MNYLQEAENILWYHHDINKSLEHIDYKIQQLIKKAGPKDLKAVSFELTGRQPKQVDDTLNVLFEIKKLTECKKTTMHELERIEQVFAEISEENGCELFGTILKAWYIDKKPKEEIADEVGYSSKRSVYDLRDKAIRKFAVRLFGLDALKVIS